MKTDFSINLCCFHCTDLKDSVINIQCYNFFVNRQIPKRWEYSPSPIHTLNVVTRTALWEAKLALFPTPTVSAVNGDAVIL